MSGKGQDVLIQAARPAIISWLLYRHVPAFLILLLPPLALAALWGDVRLAGGLMPGLILVSILMWRGHDKVAPREIRRLEGLIISGIAFGLASLVMTPAFMTSGLGLVDGLFEAVSAVTTTGLSVHPDVSSLQAPQLFLRHWTQWCSGLAVLMWLGRVEFLAVLLLLMPRTWRA